MELCWLSVSRGEWRGTRHAGERGKGTVAPHHTLTIPVLSPAHANVVHKRHILPPCSVKMDKVCISSACPAVLAPFPAHSRVPAILLEGPILPSLPMRPGLRSWGCCV